MFIELIFIMIQIGSNVKKPGYNQALRVQKNIFPVIRFLARKLLVLYSVQPIILVTQT